MAELSGVRGVRGVPALELNGSDERLDLSDVRARRAAEFGCVFTIDSDALGWRVFPVVPRGKRPLYAGWQHDATTDPGLISRY
jgi:hypothetical protein